ncbi:hypothetical protein AURDEDRAFT_110107 [Auricularia subglabra TFB-10046 SS5]|nr:hypothetical protein AURDEDRAFT_110107 [Auricularia subglabra TFB-10046 SS5]
MAVPSDSVFSRTLRSSFRALCARHLPGALFNKFSRDAVARRSVQFNMARRSVTTAPSRAQPPVDTAVIAPPMPAPTAAEAGPRGCEQPSFYAQALYDFATADPHQLSMRKGDLMRIVKTEETGWWAATHASDTRVGWIPKDFVRPLRPARKPTQAAQQRV